MDAITDFIRTKQINFAIAAVIVVLYMLYKLAIKCCKSTDLGGMYNEHASKARLRPKSRSRSPSRTPSPGRDRERERLGGGTRRRREARCKCSRCNASFQDE